MTALDAAEDQWLPRKDRLRPQIADLLPEDLSREFDDEDMLRFFEELAEGGGAFEIGLSLGWSPAQIKRFTTEPSRAELITAIRQAGWESLERSFIRHAHAGNSTAMKLVAFTHMRHMGYTDRKEISVSAQSQIEIVLSAREAIETKARELVSKGGKDGVAALQLLSGLEADDPDDDDGDIVEGEVIFDSAEVHR